MKFAVNLLRRFLGRLGYETRQVSVPTLRLDDFFSSIGQLLPFECEVHIFDDDPRTLREMLRAAGQRKTHLHDLGLPVEALYAGRAPPKLTWCSVNVERVPLESVLGKSWPGGSSIVIASASIGAFDRGQCDFPSIVDHCSKCGLELLDVGILNQPVVLNFGQSRVLLIFATPEIVGLYTTATASCVRRVAEARAFLPVPAAQNSTFRWLTRAGTFGHEAGVFNPGAYPTNSGYVSLMRGESEWWPSQKASEIRHFSSWSLDLVELDSSFQIALQKPLPFKGTFLVNRFRIEDFRLFGAGGKIYCNHAVVTLESDRAPVEQPVQLESQIVRVGLSTLSESHAELVFVGFPSLDLPTRSIEKNWAMLARGDDVFLIYSMSPYRVLRATNWPQLTFTSIVDRHLSFPVIGSAGMIRNSVNPVDYDEHHFLHVVHVVHPSKQYVFWALLVEKESLMPRYFCEIPLARAGNSVGAAIIYVCSVVAEKDRVLLFAGINDCGSGVWTIDRAILDSRWRKMVE
jgi:hypothetical protein